jgi:hypothetical protein
MQCECGPRKAKRLEERRIKGRNGLLCYGDFGSMAYVPVGRALGLTTVRIRRELAHFYTRIFIKKLGAGSIEDMYRLCP